MKNLVKLLFAVLILGITFVSCKSNDYNDDDYWKQVEQNNRRIDSILKDQAPLLKKFALDNFENPQFDDSTGFWFDVLQTPTDEDDKAFEYVVSGNGWKAPLATVKYTGKLVKDGSTFDSSTDPVEMRIIPASQFNQGLILAWPIAFYPKSIKQGGKEYPTGLLEKGMKKGSKIRFIAPSPYCYDNRSLDKIPANSPLDFTIEVTKITQ